MLEDKAIKIEKDEKNSEIKEKKLTIQNLQLKREGEISVDSVKKMSPLMRHKISVKLEKYGDIRFSQHPSNK